jgi:hypothetical protein
MIAGKIVVTRTSASTGGIPDFSVGKPHPADRLS